MNSNICKPCLGPILWALDVSFAGGNEVGQDPTIVAGMDGEHAGNHHQNEVSKRVMRKRRRKQLRLRAALYPPTGDLPWWIAGRGGRWSKVGV